MHEFESVCLYPCLFVYVCVVVTCPVLQNPTNGNVQHPSGVEYLSTAQYTCNFGFTESSGDGERTCQANGAWSGTELICLGKSTN